MKSLCCVVRVALGGMWTHLTQNSELISSPSSWDQTGLRHSTPPCVCALFDVFPGCSLQFESLAYCRFALFIPHAPCVLALFVFVLFFFLTLTPSTSFPWHSFHVIQTFLYPLLMVFAQLLGTNLSILNYWLFFFVAQLSSVPHGSVKMLTL